MLVFQATKRFRSLNARARATAQPRGERSDEGGNIRYRQRGKNEVAQLVPSQDSRKKNHYTTPAGLLKR